MKSRKIQFENRDKLVLSGRLDLPDDENPRAYGIFAHCFTCSKNLNVVSNINRSLTARGLGILRFDFTGLGESDGAFADTNFSTNVADLEEAYHFMAEQVATPQLLIGHSLGGAAVLRAAAALPSVNAVVTIGAPSDPSHVQHLFADHKDQIYAAGEAQVQLAGRPFKIKKHFLDDLAEHVLGESITKLKRPLLVCHAPFDNTVGIENASEIFGLARHPKSFLSLDGADHLLSAGEDSRYAGHVIAAWAEKYLDLN